MSLALAREFEPVLETVASFRAVALRQLHSLVPLGLGYDALRRVVRALESSGHLASYRLPGTSRTVIFLTIKGLDATPRLRARFSGRVARQTADLAIYGWQRAETWVQLAAAGWVVGRDRIALRVLRDHLLGAAAHDPSLVERLATSAALRLPSVWEPYRCLVCGHSAESIEPTHTGHAGQPCPGHLRLDDPALFDIAYRPDGAEPPQLLLVDNPYRAVLSQLNELPLRVVTYDAASKRPSYQAPLALLYLPPDDGSLWDPQTASWAQRGPRLRTLERYATALRPPASDAFPFGRTVRLIAPPRTLYFAQLARPASRDARTPTALRSLCHA